MGRLKIVFDASFVIAVVLENAPKRVFDLVLGEELFVPGNFRSEIAAVLIRELRRGSMRSEDVQRAIDAVSAIPAVTHLPSIGAIVSLTSKHGIGAYDAAYLATAHEVDGQLATLDGVLAKAADAEKRLWKAPGAGGQVSFMSDAGAADDARLLLREFEAKHGAIDPEDFLRIARAQAQ